MKKPLLFLCLLLAFTACAARCRDPAEVQQRIVVGNFYDQYMALHLGMGLPKPAQLKRIEPYLTPRIAQLLKEARIAQARAVRNTPQGDKPDIIEGDIFTGLLEGADSVKTVNDYTANGAWIVEIEGSKTVNSDKPYIWRDKVWLVQENGRWRIDNVAYATGGSLVQMLTGYVREEK